MSTATSTRATVSAARPRISAAPVLLAFLWVLLALRVGLAVHRGEPFSGDASMPAFALFVTTVVLANRVWFYLRPAPPTT
ncbi:MAG: hypothetical protein HOO96_05545 [Polyangiaceae bacterium]|nr:hypothetical protein [Polyangiaceae bacterium]